MHRWAIAWILGLMLAVGSAAQARNISMVTTNWSPYFADSLEEGGFFTALVRASLKAAGHDSSIRFVPWKRAMTMVERGQSDLLMGAYYKKERTRLYRYSDPIFPVKVVFMAHKRTGLKHYNSLKDLKGYPIAITLGWYYGKAFEDADYLIKETAQDLIDHIRKLHLGRVEIVAGSEVVLRHEITRFPNLDLKDVTVLTPSLTLENLFVMTSREAPGGRQLIRDFNRGLKIIRENGEFQAILLRFNVSS